MTKEYTKSTYKFPEDAPGYKPYLDSITFFLKVSFACSLLTSVLSIACHSWSFSSFWYLPLILSLVHASVFYPVGWLCHNAYESGWFPSRMQPQPRKVAKQTMDWSIKATVQGEAIGFVMNCCFLGFAVNFGGMQYSSQYCPVPISSLYDFLKVQLWYLFNFWAADVFFFSFHWWFHSNPWAYRTIHKKHHSFLYQVAWSGEVKTLKESIIISITDLLPHLVFGGHFIYILSWVVIGTLYNLENHSGYSFLFIVKNSFHHFHHTANIGNYGLAPYLDHLFGTCKKWEKWIKRSD